MTPPHSILSIHSSRIKRIVHSKVRAQAKPHIGYNGNPTLLRNKPEHSAKVLSSRMFTEHSGPYVFKSLCRSHISCEYSEHSRVWPNVWSCLREVWGCLKCMFHVLTYLRTRFKCSMRMSDEVRDSSVSGCNWWIAVNDYSVCIALLRISCPVAFTSHMTTINQQLGLTISVI